MNEISLLHIIFKAAMHADKRHYRHHHGLSSYCLKELLVVNKYHAFDLKMLRHEPMSCLSIILFKKDEYLFHIIGVELPKPCKGQPQSRLAAFKGTLLNIIYLYH